MSRLQWAGIVERAAVIVSSYAAVGGCTLRQVYYRLVSEGVIPHTAPTYRRLSARLAQARRDQEFPDLIDPLREVHVPPSWSDVGAFLREAPGWFALDRTAGQTAAVYVACEKDTLRAQLTGWVQEAGIPVLVVRGFGSQSYVQVVRERTATDTRPAVLLYVGDFDASGSDIERDWVARTDCWTSVERVLLTHDQVRAYELPPAEGKAGDPGGPRSPATISSTPADPFSGRSRPSTRPNSGAWCSLPLTRTSTTPSWQPQVSEEERQRAQLQMLTEVAVRSLNRHGDGSANGDSA